MNITQTIERTALTQLVTNEQYARKVLPFMKGDYFSDKIERTVFEEIAKFVDKYNKIPTQTSLEIEVQSRKDLNEEEFKKIVDQRFRVLKKSYEGKLTKGIAQVSAQWEQQRLIDIRRIQGDLSYLQMLQKLTRQEATRNKILISSMADRYLMTQVSK